jgi:hypothetical protein
LRPAPLNFPPREVLVASIDGFELAAIDRNAWRCKQAHLPTQFDELYADLLDRWTVVLTEIGNRLVIRNQPTRQPHHFNVASGLTLQPPARLNTIEIAVNVKLQQPGRMIRRPASCLGSNPIEPHSAEIKFVNEGIDRPNRIVLIDPVLQAFGK